MILKKRFLLFVGTLIFIFINVITIFAKTYDISKIDQVTLITEYDEDTTVDEMDTVVFGSYPQSDTSGNTKDPIEWIVLDRDGDKALLLSKYILDYKSYNGGYLGYENKALWTWENSKIRNWLNSTFYNAAFSNEEKNIIENSYLETIVVDKKENEEYEMYTNDRVFLISQDEAVKYTSHNFYERDGISNDKRLCSLPTAYMYEKNAFHTEVFLRCPIYFESQSVTPIIRADGSLGNALYGGSYCGIRPAIWVSTNGLDELNYNNSYTELMNSSNTNTGVSNVSGQTTINNNASYNSSNQIIVTTDDVNKVYYVDDGNGARIVIDFNEVGKEKIKNGTERNLNGFLYVVRGSDEPFQIRVKDIIDTGIASINLPSMFSNDWTKNAVESVQNQNVFAYIAEDSSVTYDYNTGSTLTKNIKDERMVLDSKKNGNLNNANNVSGTNNQNRNSNYVNDTSTSGYNNYITGLPNRDSELRNEHFYLDDNLQRSTWVYYVKDYYHVDEYGNIEKNKWIEFRYVGADGKMYRGRQTPDGQYVGSDGLIVNVTQDLFYSVMNKTAEPDSWYLTQSGLWYYFENDRTTTKKGWFKDHRDDQWYYFDLITGVMQVGWKEINGKYYYFNESHDNEPNWYATGGGFFDSYGKKVKAYGSMFKSEKTPDGYWVNWNGEYILNGNVFLAINPIIYVNVLVVILIILLIIYLYRRKAKKNIKTQKKK